MLFCVIVGIPLGILTGKNNRFEAILRPFLDAIQTTPAFVYLVPVVMLFSIGTVSGVIATIIFALPPIIRLTSLGIRLVDKELVEAGIAFGATPWQLLLKVQLPRTTIYNGRIKSDNRDGSFDGCNRSTYRCRRAWNCFNGNNTG